MNKNQSEIKHMPPKKNLGDLFHKNSSGDFEIYCICVNDKEIPLICQQLVLIYTEYDHACRVAKSFSDLYEENAIQVAKINDVNAFFTKMWASILKCFIVNGDGSPHYFADYCSKPINNKMVEEMNIYEEIKIAQPSRRVASDQTGMKSASILEAIKRLPKIHRNRLITSYVCGLFLILGSIILSLFSDSSSFWLVILILAMPYAFFIGLINAIKVSDKLKEKNPKIANLAKLSLLLYLAQIVIFIVAVVNS